MTINIFRAIIFPKGGNVMAERRKAVLWEILSEVVEAAAEIIIDIIADTIS